MPRQPRPRVAQAPINAQGGYKVRGADVSRPPQTPTPILEEPGAGKDAPPVIVFLKDPSIGERLARDLSLLGFTVCALDDAMAVQMSVMRSRPAAVVVEDRAVGMNPLRFAGELRGEGPRDLPVIVVSNLRLRAPALEAMRLDLRVGEILLKPFSLQDLVRVLDPFVKPDGGASTEKSITDYSSPAAVFCALLGKAMRVQQPTAVVHERSAGSAVAYVHGHKLVSVTSSDQHYMDLGGLLVDEGLVRASDLEWAREELLGRRSDARLGELLTAYCGLKERDLNTCLRLQAKRRFTGLFGWRHGTTEVRTGEQPPHWAARVHLDLRPLVLAGLGSHGDEQLRTSVLGSRHLHRFDLPRSNLGELTRLADSEGERRFLALLAEGKPVPAAVEAAGLGPERAAVWVTYLAYVEDLVEERAETSGRALTAARLRLRKMELSRERQDTRSRKVSAERAFALGIRKMAAGLFKEAKDQFTKVVEAAPERGDALAHLAWCHYRAGQDNGSGDNGLIKEVVSLLRKACQIADELGFPYVYVGRIQRDQGNQQRAAAAFLKALELDPGNTDALAELRRLHRPAAGEPRRATSLPPVPVPAPAPPKTNGTARESTPHAAPNVTATFRGPRPERDPAVAFALVLLEWEADGPVVLPGALKSTLVQLVQERGATLEEFSMSRVCAVIGFPDPVDGFRFQAAHLALSFLGVLQRAVASTSDSGRRLTARVAVVPGQADPGDGDAVGEVVAGARRLIAAADPWQVVASESLYRGFEGLVDVRPLPAQPGVIELCGCAMETEVEPTSRPRPRSGRLMQTLSLSPGEAGVTRTQTTAATQTMAPGALLGHYELRGLIGTGGMGEVYLGRDTLLDRPVAIKVMRRDVLASPTSLRRFQREAQGLASVNCPNVTHVYALALDATPPYLVMELVDGPSLKQVLSERCNLPLVEALDVALQTVNGLETVYGNGLIHRDVNPKNLLLAPSGTVKITDFGLVKMELATSSLSSTAAVVGTPLYISPEQAQGAEVDFRTDLYSLGVTLFHVLAGRPPFSGRTVAEILTKHILEEVPPLSSVGVPVPPEVDALVGRLTAKLRDDRPASYTEVRQELETVLAQVS